MSIDQSGASVTSDALPPVSIQPPALLQILQNIISNALKYQHPDRAPRIHVSARLMDGFVEFAVRDNGIGIAPEHRERIFGLFQRLDPESKYSGLGLGLAMCARLVRNQGGEIRAEPAAGGGSVFLFTLPAAPPREAGQTATAG